MDLNHRLFHCWHGASEWTLATASHYSLVVCERRPAEGSVAVGVEGARPLSIYSQHPNRGKVQILATFADEGRLRSTTVTSVETTRIAEPIVDALNRISSSATVPVSVWDTRDHDFRSYPQDHLSALSDPQHRKDLLTGTHSLWYEYTKFLLHEALADLDRALSAVSAAVRTAVEAEVILEAKQLRSHLAEFDTGLTPDSDTHRDWDFEAPTLLFDGGDSGLDSQTREAMNRIEERDLDGQIERAVDDLRILLEAHARSTSTSAHLEIAAMVISDEPYGQTDIHGYFLDITTPTYGHPKAQTWRITVNKWVPDSDDADDEESSSATGEPLVECVLDAPPRASDVTMLLDQVGTDETRLVSWAKTQVGEPLAGTSFIVTHRHDHP